ncbi:hypothetical protein e1012e08.tmp0213 [Eimeria tenella]|uniref:Uncharacterized protein n=1 Tax=Eimeria tenella TaxID=5802 RepID=C8TDL0_EIMTE|nr:hypothetical protein e1012e08.tmp0151 [Eimeria tenella]CAK51354.1 hypothetical protein e1012e08.tmp0213 [Eimeria tenella]
MLRLLGIAADAKARMLHEDAEQLRWRASDVGILVCNESVGPVERVLRFASRERLPQSASYDNPAGALAYALGGSAVRSMKYPFIPM